MIGPILLVAAILATTPAVVEAQAKKVLPVDEAAHDPEFFAFRARLLVALQQRDLQFLYGIVADDIRNSFGGDGGIDGFKARWKPEDASSELWKTLTQVLALGGQFAAREGTNTFVAPYVFTVETGADPFENWVIIGDAVRVRAQPDEASPILARLSFDVVRVTGSKATPGPGRHAWMPVQLADGRTGWVASEFIRSPVDYRAIFARRAGRWLLEALIAGD